MAMRPTPTDTNMPYTELNALYTLVVPGVPLHKIEKALDILSFVLTIDPILSAIAIEDTSIPEWKRTSYMVLLLSLQMGDIEDYLANLSSLVQVECLSSTHRYQIRFLHVSLGDFLLDPTRSHKFYCNPERIITKLVEVCIQHLNAGGMLC